MQRESSRILLDYWNALRAERPAPERREIEPTKIRSALSNTFILETSNTTDFNFRLAGSHLCSAYCRELKNRSFVSLWQQKDRDAVSTLIRAVTDDCAVAVVTFEGTTSSNNTISFETILLPLFHNGSTQTRLLGGMEAFDEPYWFGSQPMVEQKITGLRLIWPDDLQNKELMTPQLEPELSVVSNAFNANISGIPSKVHGVSARRYNHLAVIDGGRN